MTYNERIQAIAEEMAKSPLQDMQLFWTNTYLLCARIAVKHMAEAVKQSVLGDQRERDTMDITIVDRVNQYLKEKGLIPEQEAGTK